MPSGSTTSARTSTSGSSFWSGRWLVNHGQGVGFNVFGFVVDKKMLTMMAVKLYAGGSAAFTALLAYSAYAPGAGAAGDAQCGLSAAQVDMVQSVLHDRNASCSYNMTVDEILGM